MVNCIALDADTVFEYPEPVVASKDYASSIK